jgi:hypothetical protein
VKSPETENRCPKPNGVYHRFFPAQAASSQLSFFSGILERGQRLLFAASQEETQKETRIDEFISFK